MREGWQAMSKAKTKGQPYKVAVAEGLRHYFTGEPCKNGNIALRRTTDRACLCDACVAVNNARRLAAHHAKKQAQEAAQNLENAQGAE